MFNEPVGFHSIFLIAIGAILGSISRMLFIRFFQIRKFSSASALVCLNIIATFLLGYFLGIKETLNQLQGNIFDCFLLIGFIGSFSRDDSLNI